MKLTKAEIQFIDTYLKNSEVIYYDIRIEMVDHIATAVEEKMSEENLDFLEAFKQYMVMNKKEILKNNKYNVAFSWQAVKHFLLFLIQPKMLVLLVLCFLFYHKIEVNNYFPKAFTIGNFFFVLVMVLAVFQILYFYVYLKKRYYAIEKTGSILTLIYYVKIIYFQKEQASNIELTAFTFLFLGYLIFFTAEIIKFNKHQFKFI